MYSAPNTYLSCNIRSFLPFPEDFFSGDEDNFSQELMLTEQVIDYYHAMLKSSPDILYVLAQRGISQALIDTFKIGYSDRTVGLHLMPSDKDVAEQMRGALSRVGLLKCSGHEWFRGAIVIPYVNKYGRIVGGYGRRFKQQPTSKERSIKAYHLYWNDDQVTLFNHQALDDHDTIILCKGAIEALTLLSAGFNNAVACMGIKGFNEIQRQAILAVSPRTVYIAFDNTPIGDVEAVRIAKALEGIDCQSIRLPHYYDVNQFFMTFPDARLRFEQCLSKAQSCSSLVQWNGNNVTIKACIKLYLDYCLDSGNSERTLRKKRTHLTNFLGFCVQWNLRYIHEIHLTVLESYHESVRQDRSGLTGTTLSEESQRERIEVVSHCLSRLHRLGVMDDRFFSGNQTRVLH